MIRSTSNTPQPGGITPADSRPTARPVRAVETPDTLDTAASTSLRQALAALPEARPEAVEQGRELAVDPNYPPRAIIEDIARLMIRTQDLSDQA